MNAGQEVTPDSHHRTERWDPDGDRDLLARGYETGSEPHSAPAEAVPESDTGGKGGAFVLHTSLFGELVIPSRAGHGDELVDLAQRATSTQCVPAATHPLRLSFRLGRLRRLSRDLGREPLAGDPETIAM